jgi:hypothetical protein
MCISVGGRKTIGGCGHLGSTTNIRLQLPLMLVLLSAAT